MSLSDWVGPYREQLNKFVVYVVAYVVLPPLVLVLGGNDPKKWWSICLTRLFGFEWRFAPIDDYRLTQWRLEVAGFLRTDPSSTPSPQGPLTYIHHYECLADLFFHDLVTKHSTMLMVESKLAFLRHCLQALVITFVHRDLWPSGPTNIEANLDMQYLGAMANDSRTELAAYPQTILSLDGRRIVELASLIDNSKTPNIVEYVYNKRLPIKIVYSEGTDRFAAGIRSPPIKVLQFPAISSQAIKSTDALEVLIQRSLRLACRWDALDRLKELLEAHPASKLDPGSPSSKMCATP